MGLLSEKVVCAERADRKSRNRVCETVFISIVCESQGVNSRFAFLVGRSLAPGAQVLLKPLTDPSLPPEERLDIEKQIRRLNIKEWALIVRAFDSWPFAPEVRQHGSLLHYCTAVGRV